MRIDRLWTYRRHYVREAFARAIRRGRGPLERAERRAVARWGAEPAEHPVVFIVGSPRTGSTLLYQVLTNRYDVLFGDNVVALFVATPHIGFQISAARYGRRPHDWFASDYGDTFAGGYHAPSECPGLWNRWFATEGANARSRELSDDVGADMGRTFASIVNRFDRPLVLKNLMSGQLMPTITRFLPTARFISIRRDPYDVAASIWKGRRAKDVPADELFGTGPPRWDEIRSLPEARQIAAHVHGMEEQIATDGARLGPDRFTSVRYETLCENPGPVLDRLGAFMAPGLSRRARASEPSIRPRTGSALDGVPDEVAAALRVEVARLWPGADAT